VPEPEVLLSGLAVGESPRWHDDRLWLCHWGQGEVLAVDLDGGSEVVARVETTIPFSIDWLADGRLLIVSGPERLVLVREPDGRLAPYADLSALSEHGFNEIVVDGHGRAYVNGAGFDLMAGADPAPGLVAVVMPDRSPRRVAGEIAFPNGMAVTPDGATLVVADSYGRRLTGFDVEPGGDLSHRRIWADLGDGTPDGICVDAEGAVWYADVPNQRCVRVREGGEALDAVQVDRGCFACMLGGPDGATLFILAAEWRGPERMFEGPRTGQVLTHHAAAPAAGWP
jgi:sugar lactone lactonase YvrE